MKVTVVVDNSVPTSAKDGFVGEHGLSLLLEVDGKKILLDVGQSDAVVRNLSLLGIHPRQLDAIVLSHGHYDHTGGLIYLLKHRRYPIPVYAHPQVFQPRYSVSGSVRRYIGIPYPQELLTTLGAEWHFATEPKEVLPGLWFSGQIPRTTHFETGDRRLVTCSDGCDCQDPIYDDTNLFYASNQGLVVISGCTHTGLVNAVRRGMAVTNLNRWYGWVGGTHLGPVSEDQQHKTLAFIDEMAPAFLAANHCTGFSMMTELAQRLGKRFIAGNVSVVIEC